MMRYSFVFFFYLFMPICHFFSNLQTIGYKILFGNLKLELVWTSLYRDTRNIMKRLDLCIYILVKLFIHGVHSIWRMPTILFPLSFTRGFLSLSQCPHVISVHPTDSFNVTYHLSATLYIPLAFTRLSGTHSRLYTHYKLIGELWERYLFTVLTSASLRGHTKIIRNKIYFV